MNFEMKKSIEILSRSPFVIESLLKGLSKERIMNNEGLGTWSPYYILGHLIHNELTDWFPRINIILTNNKTKTFDPFDRFAQMTANQEISVEELLKEFKELRAGSLKELNSSEINETKLSLTGIHPDFGEVNLKQLLSTWVVHDLVHINQITRVMAKQYKDEVGPWINYLDLLNHK
jgi:hypothetical protein